MDNTQGSHHPGARTEYGHPELSLMESPAISPAGPIPWPSSLAPHQHRPLILGASTFNFPAEDPQAQSGKERLCEAITVLKALHGFCLFRPIKPWMLGETEIFLHLPWAHIVNKQLRNTQLPAGVWDIIRSSPEAPPLPHRVTQSLLQPFPTKTKSAPPVTEFAFTPRIAGSG